MSHNSCAAVSLRTAQNSTVSGNLRQLQAIRWAGCLSSFLASVTICTRQLTVAVAFALGASTTRLSNSISWLDLMTGSLDAPSEGSYHGGLSIAPPSKRSRHQLTNFLSAQSDKFTVLVLVKLGTEIKCVYPRVISIEIQKQLRLSE